MDTQTVRIFLTGKIEPGQEIKWNMAPLPHPEGSRVDPVDAAADLAFDAVPFNNFSFFDHLVGCCADIEPVDGELQRTIDEGEMTAELEDWMEDVEWMRRGM